MRKRDLRGWLVARDDGGTDLDAALAGAWEDGVAAAAQALDLEAGKAALLAVCGQQPDAGTPGSAPPVPHGHALDTCRQRPGGWLRAGAVAAARARAAIASTARPAEGQRGPVRRRRRLVIAAAAAVIVAAGSIWYGLGGAGRPAGAVKELTAVNGCPGLAATSGTLERVTGTSLVLKTPGGEPVTATISASAKISRQVSRTVSAITNGTQVVVAGTGSAGGIAARVITVATLAKLHSPPPPIHRGHGRPSRHERRLPAGAGRAEGTVADARAGGFTLITSGGFRIQVTTSGLTRVYTQARSTVGQLRPGVFTIAVGSAKSDGTLAAATIEQGTGMMHFQHGGGIVAQPWLGCSPTAVATAAFLTAG
jgi:hypothetical protein